MAVQPHFSVYELMKHHISGVGRTPEMVVALDGEKNKAKKSHIEQVLATYLILAGLVNYSLLC